MKIYLVVNPRNGQLHSAYGKGLLEAEQKNCLLSWEELVGKNEYLNLNPSTWNFTNENLPSSVSIRPERIRRVLQGSA